MNRLVLFFRQKKLLAMAMIVMIVTVAAVTVGWLPRLIEGLNQTRLNESLEQIARQQVKALDKWTVALQSRLAKQVAAAEIITAFQQADTTALQALSEKLKAANAGAISVRLLPAGDYAAMGLRFSQLDRIQQIENGVAVFPEVLQEDKRWLVDVVVPVKGIEGQPVGYLLAAFEMGDMEKALADVPVAMAQTQLQQVFAQTKPQTVLKVGAEGGLGRSGKQADTMVPHWKIRIVPGPQLLDEQLISPWLLLVVQGGSLVLCLLALWLVSKKVKLVVEQADDDGFKPIQIKGARRIDKSDGQAVAASAIDEGLADPLFNAGDVLDLDDDFLEIRPAGSAAPAKRGAAAAGETFSAPAVVFRDYDIRGNADRDISDELARRIGLAFGSECLEQGQASVVLAGDGRKSTPRIKAALQEGLLASGCNVVDIGSVPTPLMYFATCTMDAIRSGIMVTASHNPAADNGFKMVINGQSPTSDQIQQLRDRVESGAFLDGSGHYSQQDIVPEYIDRIVSDIVLAGSYRIVLDCGNGIAGEIAPKLLEELGCDVVPLYCDVDGDFPNHDPDPTVQENLTDLIEKVRSENADLGIALDGDGDRLVVVSAVGETILPDRLLMLFAKDVVSRNPGTDIVFDVKSTRRLNAMISSYGGRPVMWKSGHSNIKNKMVETGALLGGELSGHIFFKERWYGFDDGIYGAARLLEIMSIRDQDLDSIFSTFPVCASTPEIRIGVPEDKKFDIIRRLAEMGEWGNGKMTTLDGVRVDFAKGWGLVRASNTSAALTMRFEADDNDTLITVQHVFKQQLNAVEKDLKLPF